MPNSHSMPYCRECGKELKEDWLTCPYCSQSIVPSEQKKSTVQDSVVMGDVAINDITRCVNCESTGVTIVACSLCKEKCYCNVCENEVHKNRRETFSEIRLGPDFTATKNVERISRSERLCDFCFQNRRDELCDSNCANCGIYYNNSVLIKAFPEDAHRRSLCHKCGHLRHGIASAISNIDTWKGDPYKFTSRGKNYEDTKQEIENGANLFIEQGTRRKPNVPKFNELRQKQIVEEMRQQINDIKTFSTMQREHDRKNREIQAEQDRKNREIKWEQNKIQAQKDRRKKESRFIALKEESVLYKKTLTSIKIGFLIMSPILIWEIVSPGAMDIFMEQGINSGNFFTTVLFWIWIIALDTACCLYPLFFGVIDFDKEELKKLDRELNPRKQFEKE